MISSLYPHFKDLTRGGGIFIYSDPHFGDADAYSFRFPGFLPTAEEYYAEQTGDVCQAYESFIKDTIKELDRMQIKNINRVCSKNDVLIILGDVGDIECVKKLKAGYKILVLGNHDRGASYYQRVYAEGHYEYPINDYGLNIGPDKFIPTKECKLVIDKEDNRLFDEVYEGALTISRNIILSHEPIYAPHYFYNIHGHVHNVELKGDDFHLNCCAEVINYTPICLGNLIKSGVLKKIPDIHREIIDYAIQRKDGKNWIE